MGAKRSPDSGGVALIYIDSTRLDSPSKARYVSALSATHLLVVGSKVVSPPIHVPFSRFEEDSPGDPSSGLFCTFVVDSGADILLEWWFRNQQQGSISLNQDSTPWVQVMAPYIPSGGRYAGGGVTTGAVRLTGSTEYTITVNGSYYTPGVGDTTRGGVTARVLG